jgi:hypothetical protein
MRAGDGLLVDKLPQDTYNGEDVHLFVDKDNAITPTEKVDLFIITNNLNIAWGLRRVCEVYATLRENKKLKETHASHIKHIWEHIYTLLDYCGDAVRKHDIVLLPNIHCHECVCLFAIFRPYYCSFDENGKQQDVCAVDYVYNERDYTHILFNCVHKKENSMTGYNCVYTRKCYKNTCAISFLPDKNEVKKHKEGHSNL